MVIIGGGFGGLQAARALRRAAVDVTLVDRRNFHLFQPLLYQVATGGLSPANIATPLRWLLRRQRNVNVVLAEVRGFDLERRCVLLADGELAYDSLIVATGSTHSYFGQEQWRDIAPGLKTIEDAISIRRRVLLAFERADREPDSARRRALLTFVIVGAGPTGVELAGALAEISRHTLKRDFRNIAPAEARVHLVDALDRVLSGYPDDLSEKARKALHELGVQVRTRARVADVSPGRVRLETEQGPEELRAETILWAAGVEASPLGRRLAEQSGAQLDRAGRVQVAANLSVAGHEEVFVIGDLARVESAASGPLPGVAPVAMKQGDYVARVITRRLRGRASPDFVYRDRGKLATIGRARAVAVRGRLRVSGFAAWVLWLVVHIAQLAQAENRLLVFTQWAWSYFTYGRSARLITHPAGKTPNRAGTRATSNRRVEDHARADRR